MAISKLRLMITIVVLLFLVSTIFLIHQLITIGKIFEIKDVIHHEIPMVIAVSFGLGVFTAMAFIARE